MDQVKQVFLQAFKLPQFNQQGLANFLDITQREGEDVWQCMQQFRDVISKFSYPIDPHHQRDFFIKALLSMTTIPLSQQNIGTL